MGRDAVKVTTILQLLMTKIHMSINTAELLKAVLGALLAVSLVLPFSIQAGAVQDAKQLLEAGKFNEAEGVIDAWLASHPDDAKGRFIKGLILHEQGNVEGALKVFNDMTRDFPQLPEPYNNLAVIYADRGDYDKAREALRAAILTHPSYATAHENLGDIYAKMASEAYQKALEVGPQSNEKVRVKLSLINGLIGKSPRVAPAPSGVAPARAKAAAAVKRTQQPVSPPAGADNQEREAILNAVYGWVKSWVAQDVDSYLGHYAKAFTSVTGITRQEWLEYRRSRLTVPTFIQVDISDPKIQMLSNNRAQVEFTQAYKSNTYRDSTVKRLVMTRQGNGWKILQEETIQ